MGHVSSCAKHAFTPGTESGPVAGAFGSQRCGKNPNAAQKCASGVDLTPFPWPEMAPTPVTQKVLCDPSSWSGVPIYCFQTDSRSHVRPCLFSLKDVAPSTMDTKEGVLQ